MNKHRASSVIVTAALVVAVVIAVGLGIGAACLFAGGFLIGAFAIGTYVGERDNLTTEDPRDKR